MRRAALLLFYLLFWSGAAAAAEPCPDLVAPPEIGLRENGLGTPRTPCAERSVSVRLRGGVTIDDGDSYRTFDGAALVEGRIPFPELELDLAARAADYRYARNGSLSASEWSAGPLIVGLMTPFGAGSVRMGQTIRVIVPGTDSGYGTVAWGFEVGLSAGAPISDRLSWHLGFDLVGAGASSVSHAGVTLGGGAGYRVERWLSFVVGAEFGIGWYGWDAVDALLVRAGARLGPVMVSAAVPLAGQERQDAVFGVDVSVPY